MFSTESLSNLLKKLENRLEDCMGCRACLTGIMAALEFAVAEAKGLAAADGWGKAGAARALAISGSLQALQPWEKIHV